VTAPSPASLLTRRAIDSIATFLTEGQRLTTIAAVSAAKSWGSDHHRSTSNNTSDVDLSSVTTMGLRIVAGASRAAGLRLVRRHVRPGTRQASVSCIADLQPNWRAGDRNLGSFQPNVTRACSLTARGFGLRLIGTGFAACATVTGRELRATHLEMPRS
jgi:hypothetical protein